MYSDRESDEGSGHGRDARSQRHIHGLLVRAITRVPVSDQSPTAEPFTHFPSLSLLLNWMARPEKYNLLEHNCNNFTNDVSQFLTGKPIPSYITGLPKEILDT